MKDDEELLGYLTQKALEDASFHVNSGAPAINGEALEQLVKEYREVEDIISKLSIRYPKILLDSLVYTSALSSKLLKKSSDLLPWCRELREKFISFNPDITNFEVVVKEDDEHNVQVPSITLVMHGVPYEYTLDRDFVASAEYKAMVSLGSKISTLCEEGAYVRRGERTKEVVSFVEAIDWLMSESRKGINTQRYKGLGEMNPGQLWETTMDPLTRRMLNVTIEDAIAADQMFTTLMGDQVEPRRDFIETNALSVVNLDV